MPWNKAEIVTSMHAFSHNGCHNFSKDNCTCACAQDNFETWLKRRGRPFRNAPQANPL